MARKISNGLDLQSQRIVSLADPSSATDATTKQYVDNKIDGLAYKDEVQVATTANGTLATAFVTGQTIDGYTLQAGDRILLKNQSSASENGIRIVGAGTPARASDMSSSAEFNNATVYVTNGTTLGGTEWTQTAKNPTVDTTSIVWVQKSSGTTYVAGAGLTESPAGTFNVGAGNGITVNADDVALASSAAGAGLTYTTGVLAVVAADTSLTVAADAVSVNPAASGGLTVSSGLKVDSTVGRIYETGTHSSSTSIPITHSLGKQFVCAHVFITSTGEEIYPDVTATSTTVTTFTFGSAPSANTLTFKICA